MYLVPLAVILLFASHVTSTSVLDAIKHRKKGCGISTNASLSSTTPIPYKVLRFFQTQVPAIMEQRGQFIGFSAAWVVDSAIPDVKSDFTYFPHGPKGDKSPLIDSNMYVSPRPARSGQNYVVTRENSIRDTPEDSIFQEVRLFGVLRKYKNAKGMLIYSYFSPSVESTSKLCRVHDMVRVPTLLAFSHALKDASKAMAALHRCGVRSVKISEKVLMHHARSGVTTYNGVPMPNIDYILRGYNVLYGNPIVNPLSGTDPGIRGIPVFKADYSEQHTSADGKWAVPKGIFFVVSKSCLIQFSSDESRSSKSYMDSMSTSVSVDAGYSGAQFKANVDVQNKNEELSTASYSYVKSEAVCSFYKGTVFLPLPPSLTREVLAMLKNCDTDPSDENFESLVHYFGTHFTAASVMGSKFGSESKMTTDSYELLKQQGINVGTAASYSGMFSAGYTQETDLQKEDRQKFESSRESQLSYTYGSQMPSDGSASTWASQTSDSPMPISLDLTSIAELLTHDFAVDLANINYTALRPKLVDFLTRYCSRLVDAKKAKDCMPPTEFATDGPGMSEWINTGPSNIYQDMVNENMMALVSGSTSSEWTLKIIKDKIETYSSVIEQGNYILDVTVCPNRNRFGVLHGNFYSWAYIQMYDVSDDGKNLTKGLQVKLQDYKVGPEDVSFNCLSYYHAVNGFLLVKKAWPHNFELIKIENICFANAQFARPNVFINAGCKDCNPRAGLHLGGNLFAFSTYTQNAAWIIEVLSSSEFKVLQTIAYEDKLISDIYKDELTNTVAMTLVDQMGIGDSRIVVYRWNQDDKIMTFTANLLTEKKLHDLSDVGSIVILGKYIYFGEGTTGRAFEYEYTYD